jgi:hypothetical protein
MKRIDRPMQRTSAPVPGEPDARPMMSRWTLATLIVGVLAVIALAVVALVLGQEAVIAIATVLVIGVLVVAWFLNG